MTKHSWWRLGPVVESLDTRCLFAGFVTADYLPVVASTFQRSFVLNKENGTAKCTVTPATYNGAACMAERDVSTANGGSVETDFEISSRKRGVIQFGEKVNYSDGNLLEIQTPAGMNEYPARLVPGRTTRFANMPLNVIFHTTHGEFFGSGKETKIITVDGVDPVTTGFSFPHALKIVVQEMRSYSLKSKSGLKISSSDSETITEWYAWGVGFVKNVLADQSAGQSITGKNFEQTNQETDILDSSSLIPDSKKPIKVS